MSFCATPLAHLITREESVQVLSQGHAAHRQHDMGTNISCICDEAVGGFCTVLSQLQVTFGDKTQPSAASAPLPLRD